MPCTGMEWARRDTVMRVGIALHDPLRLHAAAAGADEEAEQDGGDALGAGEIVHGRNPVRRLGLSCPVILASGLRDKVNAG